MNKFTEDDLKKELETKEYEYGFYTDIEADKFPVGLNEEVVIAISKKKKENIDEVLNLYNIRYEMDIQFGKEIHGDKEVYIDLKINNFSEFVLVHTIL